MKLLLCFTIAAALLAGCSTPSSNDHLAGQITTLKPKAETWEVLLDVLQAKGWTIETTNQFGVIAEGTRSRWSQYWPTKPRAKFRITDHRGGAAIAGSAIIEYPDTPEGEAQKLKTLPHPMHEVQYLLDCVYARCLGQPEPEPKALPKT
jgi:hypothetical protein